MEIYSQSILKEDFKLQKRKLDERLIISSAKFFCVGVGKVFWEHRKEQGIPPSLSSGGKPSNKEGDPEADSKGNE